MEGAKNLDSGVKAIQVFFFYSKGFEPGRLTILCLCGRLFNGRYGYEV